MILLHLLRKMYDVLYVHIRTLYDVQCRTYNHTFYNK